LFFVAVGDRKCGIPEIYKHEHTHLVKTELKLIFRSLADPNTEVVIAPPSLYLLLAREHLAPEIEVAAQNVFDKPHGAFTGEISVTQLKDSNITWTILGHSERRTILREDDDFVATKTKAALDGGIGVILCVGESLEEREKGVTVEVVTRQLDAVNKVIPLEAWKNVVVAYEPIWAIGTGKVATTGMSNLFHHCPPLDTFV
jgi:triosephosphate isomerase